MLSFMVLTSEFVNVINHYKAFPNLPCGQQDCPSRCVIDRSAYQPTQLTVATCTGLVMVKHKHTRW